MSARYAVVGAPELKSISPAIGATAGGAAITLTGRNFRPGQIVSFGGTPSPSVTVLSSTQLSATLPARPGTHGLVEVTVRDVSGKSVSRSDLFSYYSPKVSFDAPPRYRNAELDGTTLGMASGDFNGDGKLDVALLNYPQYTLDVFLGDGTGRFRSGSVMRLGDRAELLQTADLNGDGKVDLVMNTTKGGYVLIGKGDGSFQGPTEVMLDKYNVRWAVGDVNRDRKPDLVAATFDGSTTTVFVQFGNGDGSFSAATQIARQSNGFAGVALADFDRDGNLDVAFGSAMHVALGNGDGTFKASYAVSLMPGDRVGQTYSVQDLNGDGKLDLLTTDPPSEWSACKAKILLGKGNGQFLPMLSVSSGTSDCITDKVAIADFNKDGKIDMVLPSRTVGLRSFFAGKGDGTFLAPVVLDSSTGHPSISHLITGDFNGDGQVDLAAGGSLGDRYNGFIPYFGFGDGTFYDTSLIQTGGNPSSVVTADLNGDGRFDLITTHAAKDEVVVQLGAASGRFLAPLRVSIGKLPSAAAAADLTGDGKLDVMVAVADSNEVALLVGNGTGTLVRSSRFGVGNSPGAIAIADA